MRIDSVLVVTMVAACMSVTACERRGPAKPQTIPTLSLGQVVAQILVSNPGWHLGTNDDCTNPLLKEKLADNPTYQAYRGIGDLNGDGHTDRVLIIVKGDSGRLYWVPGNINSYDAPQVLGTLNWVKEGGIILQGQSATFGRFFSDVAVTWKWNPSTRSLDFVDDNPGSNN